LFELHRGRDTNRIIEQIKAHQIVIRKGIAMEKYGMERNCRVVVVFEKKSTQQLTLKKLTLDQEFTPYVDYFVFKNLEEEGTRGREELGQGWVNGVGEKVPIY